MKDYITHTLANGLKIIYHHYPQAIATHIAFTIHAGSRDDGQIPGTAHCFEHMLFKGTNKRNANNIINRLEIVGGEMNAFTTKEITTIYATVTAPHFKRALELLSDLTFNSTFPEKELTKEKKVISEEINMYLDTPEENIYDEFQEFVFNNHPLGPNILGTQESIKKINQETLINFHRTYYQAENIALSISSSIPFNEALKQIENTCISNIPPQTIPKRKSFSKYLKTEQTKKTEHIQCHAIIGNIAYPYNHQNRIPMLLLSNLLGGPGMNSRLNLSIREKYGYTYNIESGYSAFKDTGLFHCYFSTEKKYLHKALDLVNKEFLLLKTKPLSSLQLKQAKSQFIGQISLSEENRLNIILALGKNLAQDYTIESLEDAIKKVEKIDSKTLQDIANEIFEDNQMSSLIFTSE